MEFMKIRNVEELETLIQKVKAAQKVYATFPQEKVDAIFRAASIAANSNRIFLAKEAVAETGMGVVEDKVIKNHFASEYIFHKYKDERTCGIIFEDRTTGIQKIAEPIGIVAGVIPTTNPTSTTIFKSLLALKTRNAIIFSPHPRAKKCTVATAQIMLEAAMKAGLPEFILAWIDEPTVALSQHLMKHPDISLILATGGPGMVKAAYSSGKPAIGVGAGNTPAVIDETAHLKMAVNSILMSKTFDNGVICASEQSVIVVDSRYEAVKQEFIDRGAYILTPEEKAKVGAVLIVDGTINAAIVGQPASKIAAMAGVTVPESTKVLIGETEDIANAEPFAHEKLSPVLALYHATIFSDAVSKAARLVELGGPGHTSVLYTDLKNLDRIRLFGESLKTGRILVNMPASQGAIGDIYNFRLEPSLTLGCGSWGGNSVSENVGIKHLMNTKTVAERRENMLWFRVPPKVYFKQGCLSLALEELAGRRRAFIVTDKPLYDLKYTERVTSVLERIGIESDIFSEVEPDPSISTISRGLQRMNSFKPDIIIALGGGSPMDAAKIMWLMYEHPEVNFEGLAMRFMDIRKRIYSFPNMGQKTLMVTIPTTSGTGSEVTPFAVVTDEKTGMKYAIADYALTPHMAIVDPDLVMNMPKRLTAYSGIDAVTHGLEAFASVFASEYTNGMALESLRLLFKYLPSAYKNGASDPKAREKVHYASTLAGMAFANAFLGLCHSMAHKLGSMFHIPHGLANALMISHVILYNSTDAPRKQTPFPQYKYPVAKDRYVRIAEYLGVSGTTADEKVQGLVAKIDALKKELELPLTIKEAGVNESEFTAKLDELSEMAFDDQCTEGNPRFPLISEIRELFRNAFNGN